MRACWLLALSLAACTPDIVSGAYVCGPERSCPEGQSCDGAQKVEMTDPESELCVLSSRARPFSCSSVPDFEPDDTMEQAHLLENLGCSSTAETDGCMLDAEAADWLTFVAPDTCATAPEVQVRLAFPVAYERLAVELWDVDANMKLASDDACTSGLSDEHERRCLEHLLVPGTKYAIKVAPTGEGSCGGSCAYNRYALSVGLATSR